MNFDTLLLFFGGEGGNSIWIFGYIAIFFVLYWFLIRPQQKKAKDQQSFLSATKKGDKIVTIGGIHGKVVEVNDLTYIIDVDNGTKLKVDKAAVSLEFTKAAQNPAQTKS